MRDCEAVAEEERAHVEDENDFAMPVSESTSAVTRERRRGGGCAAIAAIGRRASGAGGAQEAGLGAPPLELCDSSLD